MKRLIILFLLLSPLLKAQQVLQCEYSMLHGTTVIKPTYGNLLGLALATPDVFNETMKLFKYYLFDKTEFTYKASTSGDKPSYLIRKGGTSIMMFFSPDDQGFIDQLRYDLRKKGVSYTVEDGYLVYKIWTTASGIKYKFGIYVIEQPNISCISLHLED